MGHGAQRMGIIHARCVSVAPPLRGVCPVPKKQRQRCAGRVFRMENGLCGFFRSLAAGPD